MKILLLLLSLQTSFAQVTLPDTEIWRIGNRFYSLLKDGTTSALFSANCIKNKDKCEAYKAVVKKEKVTVAESDMAGGKNPGSVVCKKFYGGEVLILRDTADNKNTFCKFKDMSIASAGDLYLKS